MYQFGSNSNSNFLSNQPVTFLNGIGNVYGGRLNKAGYTMQAGQILDKFHSFGGNQEQFQSWLQSICGANSRWSSACWECLRGYSNTCTNKTSKTNFNFIYPNLQNKSTSNRQETQESTQDTYKLEEIKKENAKAEKEIDSLKRIIQDKDAVINDYKLELKLTCKEKDEEINTKQNTIDYLKMLIKEKDEIIDNYKIKNKISETKKEENNENLRENKGEIDYLNAIIEEKNEVIYEFKIESNRLREEIKYLKSLTQN